MAVLGPRMQAAGLQCLQLQMAVASPDPQTRAFPGTQVSGKLGDPNFRAPRNTKVWKGAAADEAARPIPPGELDGDPGSWLRGFVTLVFGKIIRRPSGRPPYPRC